MQPKTLNQKIIIKSTPDKVYEALMTSKIHSEFTGAKAIISSKIGGKFSAYDGYIKGKNLKLVKNKLIVQSWRAIDFPDKYISKITIQLEKKTDKTEILFKHENIPTDQIVPIKKGWTDFYWKPLKKYLETK